MATMHAVFARERERESMCVLSVYGTAAVPAVPWPLFLAMTTLKLHSSSGGDGGGSPGQSNLGAGCTRQI